jgi:hypothetical protein
VENGSNDPCCMAQERKTFPTYLTKATGAVEISEPTGELSLADRRLFNFLLAYAYPNLGARQRRDYREDDCHRRQPSLTAARLVDPFDKIRHHAFIGVS